SLTLKSLASHSTVGQILELCFSSEVLGALLLIQMSKASSILSWFPVDFDAVAFQERRLFLLFSSTCFVRFSFFMLSMDFPPASFAFFDPGFGGFVDFFSTAGAFFC